MLDRGQHYNAKKLAVVAIAIAMLAFAVSNSGMLRGSGGAPGNVTVYNNYTNNTNASYYNVTSNLTNETVNPYTLNAKNITLNAVICTGSPAQYSRLTASGLECFDDVSGGGGVTSISQGTGIILTPNPITATGTISVNSTVAYLTNITTEQWVEGGDGKKNFTVSLPFRPNSTRVWINGIKKRNTFDYNESISIHTVNITSTLVEGDTLEIEYVEI